MRLSAAFYILIACSLSAGPMAFAASTEATGTTSGASGVSSADRDLENLYGASKVWREASVQERVHLFARYFLQNKSPYLVEPLGEGRNGEISQSPLYRFDGFDCTTFVETVLALSFAKSPEEFKETINRIRYKDGVVSYETRNHFPSLDWVPNNSKAGYVTDITGTIAGKYTKWSQTWIDKDQWFYKKGERFVLMGRQFSRSLGQLPYIAKEDLLENEALLARIPSGSIFNLVRPNWDLVKAAGTRLDVSHQGFLIRENGVLYMVHASNGRGRDGSDDYMGVKKEALTSYIRRVMLASPSMAGFNILGAGKASP
ncbi:N-acetylmuramoyl-L-alanine amidase-like domain-containing protein [Bdellovibrio bacteriovorus]|uniref:N-acetylmuramoyl-L-alanine amidase-like domain-containing protein n=1 Tax=Bdellovibrio bacteriovorus TaxID=959 RepID=UPI0035A5901A